MDEVPHPIASDIEPEPKHSYLLNDAQIRQAAAGRLGIIGGGYRPSAAKYASYELHASDTFDRLYIKDGLTAYEVGLEPRDGDIVIGSGETVRIYTAESINLPRYIYADVIALGQLFGAGLSAGSTYVDPGSTGSIYIAVTNHNRSPIRIPVGSPLARAQFHVLGDPVETPHGGPETRRPIRFRADDQVESPAPVQPLLGPQGNQEESGKKLQLAKAIRTLEKELETQKVRADELHNRLRELHVRMSWAAFALLEGVLATVAFVVATRTFASAEHQIWQRAAIGILTVALLFGTGSAAIRWLGLSEESFGRLWKNAYKTLWGWVGAAVIAIAFTFAVQQPPS